MVADCLGRVSMIARDLFAIVVSKSKLVSEECFWVKNKHNESGSVVLGLCRLSKILFGGGGGRAFIHFNMLNRYYIQHLENLGIYYSVCGFLLSVEFME